MAAPKLIEPIPAQIINEQAAFGPVKLTQYIEAEVGSRFAAELASGEPLPKGLICTEDGNFTGIPAKGTQGNYAVVVTISNPEGTITANFQLTIKPALTANVTAEYFDQLKSQVWEALQHKMPAPEFKELYNRQVTAYDVYYILERWATLTVWNAFDLAPAKDPERIELEGASPHFLVFDRGTCLIACPKDLFSHERTLADALQTAQAIAREVYKREWTIEFAGLDKMERALWVELQHMQDKFGKPLEILHYNPSFKDARIYMEQAKLIALRSERDKP